MQGYAARHLRVYLVDDHDIVRRGLRDLLAAARDLSIVGDSGSARRAVPAITDLRPDVMVLDVHLQDGTGIDVCRDVRSVAPEVRGLLLTSSGEDQALVSALLSGAAGCLVKLAGSLDVLGAIRTVGAGRSLIDPAEAARVVAALRASLDVLTPALTAYEQELLDLVLDQRTNREIAGLLGREEERVRGDVMALVARIQTVAGMPGALADVRREGRHRRE
jgi:DNA-binding NarL/FixJ family response regulator